MCRPKHVEQLRNIGIINFPTRSHLVGSFYEIYIINVLQFTLNVRKFKANSEFVCEDRLFFVASVYLMAEQPPKRHLSTALVAGPPMRDKK